VVGLDIVPLSADALDRCREPDGGSDQPM